MTAAKPARRPRKAAATSSEAARQAEAEEGYIIVEQRGVELRIPVGGKVPLAAIDAFRAGDNYAGTKLTLGAEQWKRLTDAGATGDDLDELGEKLTAASGN